MSMQKFEKLIYRLTNKVRASATPVTGFLVGLSGTDSILTFILLSEVAKTEKFSVTGIHYVEAPAEDYTHRFRPLFEREGADWLHDRYPDSTVNIHVTPAGGNTEGYRWGHMYDQSLAQRDWIASTVNATEKALGTHSILNNGASIQPIASLYKSEVLAICKEFGVPEEFIRRSRLPDCICGRDEFAAENIELIDAMLTDNLAGMPVGVWTFNTVLEAQAYIKEKKRDNGFKTRTPYTV